MEFNTGLSCPLPLVIRHKFHVRLATFALGVYQILQNVIFVDNRVGRALVFEQ